MKKITLFILFFAINAVLISNLFAQNLTYSNSKGGNGIAANLSLNSYEVTSINYRSETMHEINLSGIFLPNDAGMPNLPTISRFVAIPKGAEVSVAVTNMETEILQNINIAPALRIQAIPEEPDMEYVKNESVYNTNAFYPQNPVQISEVISLRGVNTVMLTITPFQFNPVTKELVVINNIDLNIEYIDGSKSYADPKYRSPWFDPILKNALLNYEVLPEIEYSAKGAKDGTGCEYLIVIPNREDFRPYAEQILEFRTKQGIYTKIMTLEDMEASNPAQIKSFIHNAYNTWDIPPVAVLLMADHNTNVTLGIPAETVSHPEGSCISDNPYADVTGNLLPEMVFARMAAENETQMAVLVSKFIEYETQPCMVQSYYQNPITALGWQTERWFQICSEAVGGYWRNQGKTPVRINQIYQAPQNTSIWSSNQNTTTVVNYFGPSGRGYIPSSPNDLGDWNSGTPAQIVTAINNGAFALQHRDHGLESGWGEPAFRSNHISQLTNVGKMTYVFTINCSTGKFNNTTPCFGEVFHRYTYQGQNAGCVGYLGPTAVSYSFVNDAFAWGMYDLFDPDFLPTYGPSYGSVNNGMYVGYSGNWMPAFGNVSGKYFLASSSWPYNSGSKNITYQMFTAHSDAFLRLFTEVPENITVQHDAVINAGISDFFISANAGTLIALTAEIDGNIEILDVATATGEMQTMTVPSDLLPTTEIQVVITGQNFLRYEGSVPVIANEGPYVVSNEYTIEGDGRLTYVSENETIIMTLKNVGVEASGALNVSLSCTDAQLTINTPSAQCGGIAAEGTATVNFKVTVANDIPNKKTFPLLVTINEPGKARSWKSNISLVAYAPELYLETIKVNGAENGYLEKNALATVSVIIANNGGAHAYNIKDSIKISNQYITLICKDQNILDTLHFGKSLELTYNLVTQPAMPYGQSVSCNVLLSAQYGIAYTAPFNVSCSGLDKYCSTGTTNCSQNDKFSQVVLMRNSDQSALITNVNLSCNSAGYHNYTSMTATVDPEEQYTIKVKAASQNQVIRGWIDWNGNNDFETNEQVVALTCTQAEQEYSQTFTVPKTAVTGKYRLRLRCRNNGVPTTCDEYSYGQTHDYSVLIAEKYPPAQNVEAELTGNNITVTWATPTSNTPDGYKIYRNGLLLNSALISTNTFKEENVSEGIYAYCVKAVYGSDEFISKISNVICFFEPCELPENLTLTAGQHAAILNWNSPVNTNGLLGYNVYRNAVKINDEVITNMTYRDEELENGTYAYQVSAVYSFQCKESNLTDKVSILITGIENHQTNLYTIYPNPTNGNVTIEGSGLNRVEIYNVLGCRLAEYNNVKDNLQINVNNFADGLYFVKLYSVMNAAVTKRLVIMK